MGFISDSISGTSISANTLYINSVGSGTPQINLGLDSNFQVVTGTTGSVTQNYKKFVGFISQTGSTAPFVVSSYQDDFGNISFGYFGAGNYSVIIPDAVIGKTIINGINPFLQNSYPIGSASSFQDEKTTLNFGGGPGNFSVILPSTYHKSPTTSFGLATESAGIGTNDVLDKYNLYIEIVVYN